MSHHDIGRAHFAGHCGTVEQIPGRPSAWETKEEHIASSDYSTWAFLRRFGVKRRGSWSVFFPYWCEAKGRRFHGLHGGILGLRAVHDPSLEDIDFLFC